MRMELEALTPIAETRRPLVSGGNVVDPVDKESISFNVRSSICLLESENVKGRLGLISGPAKFYEEASSRLLSLI
ncbi:hypothetical protein HAX54_008243 [Datura stramonium]|uniref:Uncharacterized protein n=1 Tax=Datura stramonium TaxID=4076 RepID=A0ABS8TEF7_DATST|nr:hypothetical protein [Datura stramonium]